MVETLRYKSGANIYTGIVKNGNAQRHMNEYNTFSCSQINTYPSTSFVSRYSDWLWTGLPRSRSSSSGRAKNFLFSVSSRPALGPTQPPIQWVPRTLTPGVKRPGREADHSFPASAEVKKMRIYTSTHRVKLYLYYVILPVPLLHWEPL
jgi:hypothetical protein